MIMMNLIEKLGGYEKAKNLRGTTSNALLDMKTWQVHVDDIDSALLKYRRENNIFEVGDKVTAKDNFRIGVISEIKDGSVWVVFDSASKMLSPFWHIRYATDAEIEAGYRL